MTDGPVRLTRRHFLRGALALAALPPLRGMASPHTPPLRVQGINHVSLQVRDVGRSRDFYQALFGMPVQAWQGPTPCLRIGDGPAFLALAPAPGVTPGIHHLCLAIEGFDTERAMRSLEAHGLQPATGDLPSRPMTLGLRRRGPEHGGAADGTPELYLADPDGTRVQLQAASYCGGNGILGDRCAAPTTPPPGPMALRGINHCTVFASDAAQSMAFYQRVFGMPITKMQGPMPLLDAGPSGQLLGFVGSPELKLRPHIHHVCVTIDDFQHEHVLEILRAAGLTVRDDPLGRPIPPLSAYVTQRMPDRGGAPGGTPELYFTDPDGILIQIQDTRYCGGAGYLGEACKYV